jgi:uncharacterized RDD family membrane protein YckC
MINPTCPRCGVEATAGHRFCENCGLQLPNSTTPPWSPGATGRDAYQSWWEAPKDPAPAHQQQPVDALGRPLADFSDRAVGFLVDYAIHIAIIVVAVGLGAAGTVGLTFALLLGLPAYIWMHIMNGGKSGQTPGMKVAKVRLVDATTGQPIGYGRAFVRWLLQVLMFLILGVFWLVDLLWPLWDDHRETLHDKATHSQVISVRSTPTMTPQDRRQATSNPQWANPHSTAR